MGTFFVLSQLSWNTLPGADALSLVLSLRNPFAAINYAVNSQEVTTVSGVRQLVRLWH